MAIAISVDSYREMVLHNMMLDRYAIGVCQAEIQRGERVARARREIAKLEKQIDLYKAMLSSAT